MKKKLLSILLSFAMLIQCVPAALAVEGDIASGTNNTCSWRITAEGELIIEPTNGVSGDISNRTEGGFNISLDGPAWLEYDEEIVSVTIMGEVTSKGITSNVDGDGEGMFQGLQNLVSADLRGLDTSAETSMANMFSGCSSLKTITFGDGWNTDNVTDLSGMFYGCSALETLTLGDGWDIDNVTKMDSMFRNCKSLDTLDMRDWVVSSDVSMNDFLSGVVAETIYLPQYVGAGGFSDLGAYFVDRGGEEPLVPASDLAANAAMAGWILRKPVALAVTMQPAKLNYSTAETLSLDGLVVTYFFSDTDKTVEVPFEDFGDYYLTASLKGQRVTKVSSVLLQSTSHDGLPIVISFTGDSSVTTSTNPLKVEKGDLIASGTLDTCLWKIDSEGCLYIWPANGISGKISNPVYGAGSIDFNMGGPAWLNYRSQIRSVVIGSDGGSIVNAKVISNGITSNGTSAQQEGMFEGCYKMVSADLTGLDTSAETSMANMFNGCTALTTITFGDDWSIENVTDMNRMFYGCSSLTSLDFMDGWGMETAVKYMLDVSSMFKNCTGLKEIDLSNWQVGTRLNMDSFLSGVKAERIALPKYVGAGTFNGLSDYFLDQGGATPLFSIAEQEVPATSDGWVISRPSALSIISQPVFMEYQTGDVLNPAGLAVSFSFTDTEKTVEIPFERFADNKLSATLKGTAVTPSSQIVLQNKKHDGVSIVVTYNVDADITASTAPLVVEEGDYLVFGTNNGCRWYITFEGELVIEPINGVSGILSSRSNGGFDIWIGETPWYEFRKEIKAITVKPGVIAEYITSNNDYGMFSGCYNAVTADLSGLDTSRETDMSYMFSGCSNLESVTFGEKWDTSKVKNMAGMFSSCRNLKELDLSTWDISALTKMNSMFLNCTSLSELDLSTWKTTASINMHAFLNGVTASEILLPEYVGENGFAELGLYFVDKGDESAMIPIDELGSGNIATKGWALRKPSAIAVKTQPANLAYTTADVLDPTGLEVTISFHGTEKTLDVLLADFAANHLTAKLNGTIVTLDSQIVIQSNLHNEKSIIVAFDDKSDLSAATDPLTVAQGDYIAFGTRNECKWYITIDGDFFLEPIDGVSGVITNKETTPSGNTTYLGSNPWKNYVREIKTITVKPGVTSENITSNYGYGMFEGCYNAVSADLSGLDTSRETSMAEMFRDCEKLKTITFGDGWNVDKVTDMTTMFYGCESLTELDMSDWDTEGVTMQTMLGQVRAQVIKLPSHMNTGVYSNLESYFLQKTPGSEMIYGTSFEIGASEGWVLYRPSSIDVTDPAKMNYTGGEVLELAGLAATLNFSGIEDTLTVSFEDFGDYAMTAWLNKTYYPSTQNPVLMKPDVHDGQTMKVRFDADESTQGETTPLAVGESVYQAYGSSGGVGWYITQEGQLVLYPLDGVSGLLSNYRPWNTIAYRLLIKSVLVQPGVSTKGVAKQMFKSCSNLVYADLTHLDTSLETSMADMFYGVKAEVIKLPNQMLADGFTKLPLYLLDKGDGELVDLTAPTEATDTTGWTLYRPSELSIATQPTLEYDMGARLDLSAMQVALHLEPGKTKVVDYSDFEKYHLTATLLDQTFPEKAMPQLWPTLHNGKILTVKLNDWASVETDPLTVTNKAAAGLTANGTIGGVSWEITDLGELRLWPTDGVSGVMDGNDDAAALSETTTAWQEGFVDAIAAIKVEAGVAVTNGAAIGLFKNLNKVAFADVSNLDISLESSLKDMFAGCSSIQELDLSAWNTDRIDDMDGMLNGVKADRIKLPTHLTSAAISSAYFWDNPESGFVVGYPTGNTEGAVVYYPNAIELKSQPQLYYYNDPEYGFGSQSLDSGLGLMTISLKFKYADDLDLTGIYGVSNYNLIISINEVEISDGSDSAFLEEYVGHPVVVTFDNDPALSCQSKPLQLAKGKITEVTYKTDGPGLVSGRGLGSDGIQRRGEYTGNAYPYPEMICTQEGVEDWYVLYRVYDTNSSQPNGAWVPYEELPTYVNVDESSMGSGVRANYVVLADGYEPYCPSLGIDYALHVFIEQIFVDCNWTGQAFVYDEEKEQVVTAELLVNDLAPDFDWETGKELTQAEKDAYNRKHGANLALLQMEATVNYTDVNGTTTTTTVTGSTPTLSIPVGAVGEYSATLKLVAADPDDPAAVLMASNYYVDSYNNSWNWAVTEASEDAAAVLVEATPRVVYDGNPHASTSADLIRDPQKLLTMNGGTCEILFSYFDEIGYRFGNLTGGAPDAMDYYRVSKEPIKLTDAGQHEITYMVYDTSVNGPADFVETTDENGDVVLDFVHINGEPVTFLLERTFIFEITRAPALTGYTQLLNHVVYDGTFQAAYTFRNLPATADVMSIYAYAADIMMSDPDFNPMENGEDAAALQEPLLKAAENMGCEGEPFLLDPLGSGMIMTHSPLQFRNAGTYYVGAMPYDRFAATTGIDYMDCYVFLGLYFVGALVGEVVGNSYIPPERIGAMMGGLTGTATEALAAMNQFVIEPRTVELALETATFHLTDPSDTSEKTAVPYIANLVTKEGAEDPDDVRLVYSADSVMTASGVGSYTIKVIGLEGADAANYKLPEDTTLTWNIVLDTPQWDKNEAELFGDPYHFAAEICEDYVEGMDLVLVYTNADITAFGFEYDGTAMKKLVNSYYLYQNNRNYGDIANIFALVVPNDGGHATIDRISAYALTARSAVETVDCIPYDINSSGTVDLRDAVLVQTLCQDSIGYYDNQEILLKADVLQVKKVNNASVSAIIREYKRQSR